MISGQRSTGQNGDRSKNAYTNGQKFDWSEYRQVTKPTTKDIKTSKSKQKSCIFMSHIKM